MEIEAKLFRCRKENYVCNLFLSLYKH